jgi:hypothetical protein
MNRSSIVALGVKGLHAGNKSRIDPQSITAGISDINIPFECDLESSPRRLIPADLDASVPELDEP